MANVTISNKQNTAEVCAIIFEGYLLMHIEQNFWYMSVRWKDAKVEIRTALADGTQFVCQ